MTQYLRMRCNELAELEKENKKQKTKMIGGGQSSNQSNKDTLSQAGSVRTKNRDEMANLKLSKKASPEKKPFEKKEE